MDFPGCTIENDLILQYWVVFDRTTPGLWRSPNGEIIPLRALRTEVKKTHGANFAQITGKGVASLRDANGVSEKEMLSFKMDDENDELKKIRCFAAIFLFSRIFLIPLR